MLLRVFNKPVPRHFGELLDLGCLTQLRGFFLVSGSLDDYVCHGAPPNLLKPPHTPTECNQYQSGDQHRF